MLDIYSYGHPRLSPRPDPSADTSGHAVFVERGGADAAGGAVVSANIRSNAGMAAIRDGLPKCLVIAGDGRPQPAGGRVPFAHLQAQVQQSSAADLPAYPTVRLA